MKRWSAAALVVLAGCGGGGPSSPNPAPTPAPVTLVVVSAETGQPVSGAQVSVAGAAAVATNGAGNATVNAGSGSDLRLEAAGYFVRTTLYRGDPRLTLWPERAGAGAGFVQELVFNTLIADGALTRPVIPVTFVPMGVLREDPAIRQVHEAAAALLDAVVGDVIAYDVALTAPAGHLAIEVKVDGADPFLAQNPGLQAVTRIVQQRNRITSGSITFKTKADAGLFQLVSHEMGHAFGLGHPAQPGLMSPATIGGFRDFTAAEKLEMRVMLQRLPGTRPPDDDRGASLSSAGARSAVVGCGEGAP